MTDQYRGLEDLPEHIAVFPLAGALLFPRWSLPLNIFEPRYLNMIDDAMASSRLIGMVQSTGGDRACPDLAHIGCVGRITSYSETEDGRYLVSLTGICRFNIIEELDVSTPYRQVHADWSKYATDFRDSDEGDLPDRSTLTAALRTYSERNTMEVDWDAVGNAPLETLINALCAGCPFNVMEKQALLEAETVVDRGDTLIKLLEMDLPGGESATLQ
ncbi:MAG: LON peptidase substrate-binding domain-containing protein [Pseudomonadota bacterium]